MTKMTIRLSPIRVGAGLSTRKSGLAATQDALDAALGPLEGAIPDLAFLFVAPQFEDELESILQSANASLGGGTLVGCVAGGVIGGAREVEDAPAISAWAATLPGVTIRPFTLTYSEEEEHGVFDGLEEVPTRAPDSVLVMLADPYTFPAHLLLDHLNEHAPGLPVVGGMASGGIVAGRTRLIADDEILTEGAIGAILEGAHGATAVVSQGCRPARICGQCSSRNASTQSLGPCCSRAMVAVRAYSVSRTTMSLLCAALSARSQSLDSSRRASSAPSRAAISSTASRHRSFSSGTQPARSYNSLVRWSSGQLRKWLSW